MVVDSRVLSQLRHQLRSDKRCFTGEKFISKVMEIGRSALADTVGNSDRETPASPGNSHVLSPTGQYIEYNKDYAGLVAQYLLDEGILIHVSQVHFQSDGSSILLTPEQISDESDPGNQLASSYEGKDLTDSVRRLGINSAVSFASGAQSAVSFASGISDPASAMDSPGQSRHPSRQSVGTARTHSTLSRDRYSEQRTPRAQHYQYERGQNTTRRRSQQQHLDRPVFSAEANMYYKFAGSEDDEFAFFQSQILMSSIHLSSQNNSLAPGPSAVEVSSRPSTSQDLVSARMGTLCLVYNLLSQRARKEGVAKQFLHSPRVQEQRQQALSTNCDLIFKM